MDWMLMAGISADNPLIVNSTIFLDTPGQYGLTIRQQGGRMSSFTPIRPLPISAHDLARILAQLQRMIDFRIEA
jgi:hypothetical protein